jgi:Zn-dependent peptidase ImmA (M78 family)/transcriptional regulator with XRE-family HTH domain
MTDTAASEAGLPLASRIRAARDLRGLTQAEVTTRMPTPISAAALSQIEAAKVTPSKQTLRELAEALDVPVGYFFAQWPGVLPEERPPISYFRDLRSTPARERRRALAMALLLNDLVSAIEHYVRLPQLRIPDLPIPMEAKTGDVDEVADQVRSQWSLGIEPIPHVVREIERHGIPVARLSIGHRQVDAFSVAFDRRPIVLLTDDKSNYVRSRFDAAHELGHLIMHRSRLEPDRTLEPQAHQFASSFLIPKQAALEELPRRLDGQGWSLLAQLKRRWGLSMAALLRRARDLRILSEGDYRNAMKLMSAKGWRTTEPGDREMGVPESPLLLERALRTIEIEEGLTAEELAELANLPATDTLELVKATHDNRPIIEL